MHRLRVFTARSPVIPNTDRAEAEAALKALPVLSASKQPSSIQGHARDSSPDLEKGLHSNAPVALHFVNGSAAAQCAMWPTCLSLLGGAPLQSWIVQKIEAEAAPAMPPYGACVDGEQVASPSIPRNAWKEAPV